MALQYCRHFFLCSSYNWHWSLFIVFFFCFLVPEIPGRWRRHCPSGPKMSGGGCNLVGEGLIHTALGAGGSSVGTRNYEGTSSDYVGSGKCVCGGSVPWCPGERKPYTYRTRHECKLNLAAKLANGENNELMSFNYWFLFIRTEAWNGLILSRIKVRLKFYGKLTIGYLNQPNSQSSGYWLEDNILKCYRNSELYGKNYRSKMIGKLSISQIITLLKNIMWLITFRITRWIVLRYDPLSNIVYRSVISCVINWVI